MNGVPVKSSYKVKPLDRVSIDALSVAGSGIIPENIPLDIRYEDDDLIIVNKPAGMVGASVTGTIQERWSTLTYHLKRSAAVPRRRYAGPVWCTESTRIRPVSSSLPKTNGRTRAWPNSFRSFDPSGLSCAGVGQYGEADEGHGRRKYRPQRARPAENGCLPGRRRRQTRRSPITGCSERLGYVNLIECRLETGRTHQIRVHMEYIGHPLFNDERYGGDRILKERLSRNTNSSSKIVSGRCRATDCMPVVSGSSIRRPGRMFFFFERDAGRYADGARPVAGITFRPARRRAVVDGR